MTAFVRSVVVTLATVVATDLGVQVAEACSCVGTYSGSPACQARWQYTRIFRGKVSGVSKAQPDRERGIGDSAQWIHFELRETFLGVSGQTYDLLNTGSSCDVHFESGKEYLVYVNGDVVYMCSPTREVEKAAEDLKYLRAIPSTPPREGRIIGLALHEEYTQIERGRKPFEGVRVVVEGQGLRRSAVTGPDGKYEIAMPVGQYSVRAEVDQRVYATAQGGGQVKLADTRGCAVADFQVSFNGRMNSRVLTRDGTPIPHLSVKLVSTEPENRPGDIVGQTDEHGRIQLEHIPPGRFAFGFDLPDREAKDGRREYYFPGAADRLEARQITFQPSQAIELGDVVIPDTMRFVTLTGVVQDSFGKPAERATVYLKLSADRESRWIEPMIRTRADGRFAFALLDGHEYGLLVEMFTPPQGIAEARLSVVAAPDLKPVVLIPVRRDDPVYIPPHVPDSTRPAFLAFRQSPHFSLAAQR